MKKIVIVLMSIMITCTLMSCGKSNGIMGNSQIDISDIEFSISEGIVDGDRMPTFSCKNRSKYDIVGINIDYKVKNDVSDDSLSGISEINEMSNTKSHSVSEITINVINDRYIESGKSCENVPVYLDNTYTYVKSMETVNFMTPDILKVLYLKGSKIHIAYYDFKNKKMTYEEETKDAKSWSDKKIAKTIPEPEANVIIVSSDDNDYFRAVACNYTKDSYNAYIDQCQKNGFTLNSDRYESTRYTRYSAENKEGYKIDAYYTEEKNLDIQVTK